MSEKQVKQFKPALTNGQHTHYDICSQRHGWIISTINPEVAYNHMNGLWYENKKMNKYAVSDGRKVVPFDYFVRVRTGVHEREFNWVAPVEKQREREEYDD